MSVTVPDSPIAKLMYYFDCVCTCLEPGEDASIRRLRNYGNYHRLTNEEQAKLLVLCLALSPDKLIGSIFFPAGDNDFGRNNAFLELSSVNTRMVVARSILVGGQQRRVRNIMMFKKIWIEKNYIVPLRLISEGRRALPQRRARRNASSCTIL